VKSPIKMEMRRRERVAAKGEINRAVFQFFNIFAVLCIVYKMKIVGCGRKEMS
jgi:hypothetical protein